MIYKDIIESKYNRRNWQELLHDIFGSRIKFWNTPSMVDANDQIAKQALWLGTITLSDQQTISVYEVELTDNVDILRNRRGIRDMLLTAWRGNGSAGAFMLCYRKNESVLRFSYVSEAWRFNNEGDYQKESTDTKRFTYLLGEGHRSRTAIQQFEKLKNSNLALTDLTKAFSVDAVSDMFFDGYKRQYERFCQFLYDNKTDTNFFGEAFQTWEDKILRDYVKKMLGRLVFVQFLHRKGWAPNLLDAFGKHPELQDNFLDAYLEPLFGGVLNTHPDQRADEFRRNAHRGWDARLIAEFNAVPYLNGGLFESDLQDPPRSRFPKEYFSELFDFFDQYNFTIDENDPNDAEVGVDPEMLGRIFENLLEDNKDKGAFYTPKEIVQYMCRESLIAYLQTDATDDAHRERLRRFVETHDATVLHNAEYVREKIENVKICDPAIGSGAFPMGLLNELVACREALGLHIDKNANRAEIKKHIIQNSIYGVDIEKGAVDIARLRFWLSLVVDEDEPLPLPNLDYKIMQGNSLLEQYEGVDLSGLTQKKADQTGMLSIFEDTLENYRKQLRDLLNEYYNNTDHQRKRQLQQLIAANVRQQLAEQRIAVDFGTIDLAANDQFFLWHTWFNDVFEKGGFDIVIGNPPWGADLSKESKSLLKNEYPEIDSSTTNSYAYFIGWGLRAYTSSLMYVLPDSILIKDFKKTRQLLSANVREVKWYQNCSVPKDKRLFRDVEHDVCIVCLDNTNHSLAHFQTNHYENGCYVPNDSMVVKNEVLKEEFDYVFNLKATISDWAIVSKLLKYQPLSEIAQCHEGIHSGNIRDKLFIKGYKSGLKPLYYGGKAGDIIRPYVSQMCGWYVDYRTSIINKKIGEYAGLGDERLFIFPKIYVTRTGNPFKAFYDEDSYASNNFFSLQIKDYENNTRNNLLFLLPLINSKVCQFFIRKFAAPRLGDSFIETKITHLLKFPIPPATEAQRHSIIALVDNILAAKQANPQADTSEWEREIDKKVYKLYGLTDDEVKVVEGIGK